jgi:hypothetical protein
LIFFIKICLVGGLLRDVWDESKNVSSSFNSFLTAPFTMKEIHKTVFSMGADKASGPNDFLMSFYHTYWEIIKSDLLSMFEDFYKGTLDITILNRATLCLIPKVSNALQNIF